MASTPGPPQPELKISRMIHAPRQEVFDAWTTAESMRAWMCPEDGSVTFVELDLRVGGAFRIEMRVGGSASVHTGIYQEILPPERLVFTWVSRRTHYRASRVTVEFHARGDITELVLTQRQLPDEEAVARHTTGWTSLLAHLAAFLQQRGSRGRG